MHRTFETLFRHAGLVSIPLLVAVVVALAFGAVQPDDYQSATSLWFDVPTTDANPSAVPVGDATGAASEEVAVVKELLGTQAFVLAVAQRSGLATYIADHPGWQSGWAAFPGLAHVFGDASKPLETRIGNALTKGVSVVSSGPQVLVITVDGPTGTLAATTAQAIVDQFSDQVLASRRSQAEAAVQYQTTLFTTAQQAVGKAQADLSAYEAKHPQATAGTDTQLQSLATSVDLATQQFDSLVVALNTATTNLAGVGQNPGFHVIDKPSTPVSPTGATKRLLVTLVAGVIVGLVLSGLFVFVLATLDRTARRPRDVEQALGLTVIGSIPRSTPPRRTGHGRWRGIFAGAHDRPGA